MWVKRSIWMILIAALASLGATQAVAAPAVPRRRARLARTAKCQSGVYAMSASTRRRCGVKSYPRVSSRRLSDGGHAYVYDIEGARTTYYVPPAGFEPHHATKSELRRYGFGGSGSNGQIGHTSQVYVGPKSARQVPWGESMRFIKPPSVIDVPPDGSRVAREVT